MKLTYAKVCDYAGFAIILFGVIYAAVDVAESSTAPVIVAGASEGVGLISTIVGTYVVRPSQVSPALGKAVAGIPGVGGTTDEQKASDEGPPTGA